MKTYDKHPAEFARRLIAHHRAAATGIVRKAIAHRAYRAHLATHNPSAVQFFPERLELLCRSLAYHRRLIAEGYASLNAVTA